MGVPPMNRLRHGNALHAPARIRRSSVGDRLAALFAGLVLAGLFVLAVGLWAGAMAKWWIGG
jgi:hypothetical protein